MYCSINLWFTIILSYLASLGGYLYLSGYVGLMILLFGMGWTGQHGIAAKTR